MEAHAVRTSGVVRKLFLRRTTGNLGGNDSANWGRFHDMIMMHILPWVGTSTLRPLALIGLVGFGFFAPSRLWSQTPDSLPPPSNSQTVPDSAARPAESQAARDSLAPQDSLAAPDSLVAPDLLAPRDSLAIPGLPAPQDSLVSPETKTNPFSGFETHFLANGLKVWFKRLPDAPNVSISVGVPVGWDSDPRGKEELAHLTEHLLFSDHDGRTEQEIKEAIEGIGGRRNGFTTPDHTWYYVTVAKEHGAFGIEWMSRLISPHAMDAAVVDRNRQPVALEINAQPREFFERVWALLNPSWLQPRDFWRREYGMDTRNARRYDRWASLQRITPEDVVEFYDRYYVPGAMTLTVVGDLDRSEVLDVAQRAFGSLAPKPVAPREVDIQDPARRRAIWSWGLGPDVRYTARYKTFDSSAEDDLMTLFVRDLLRRRLNQRLRYGEQKAVYGLQVTNVQRGPAGYLQIQSSIDEDEYDFAATIIEEELAALRGGTLGEEEFEADRTALVERLRGENQTAEALNFWAYRNFYDPVKHRDFPDLLSFFERVTRDEVASFAARSFVPEREVTTLTRVQPLSLELLVGAALVLLILTVRLVAWILTPPVSMREIQYVARFRMPVLLQIGAAALIGGVALILARLIVFVVQSLALAFLVTVNDYTIQMTGYALMFVAAVVLFVLYLSRFPRKLLVFPDHLRIKSLAYRSRILHPDDVAEISTRRVHQVWFSKGLFRCAPLTFGLAGPGIYLRPIKGRAYFFRTRDNKEMIDVLGAWRGEAVSPAKEAPPEPARDTSEKPKAPKAPKASDAMKGSSKSIAADTSPKPSAPIPSGPIPGPGDTEGDFDYDSVGLTDEELEELLGDSPSSDSDGGT